MESFFIDNIGNDEIDERNESSIKIDYNDEDVSLNSSKKGVSDLFDELLFDSGNEKTKSIKSEISLNNTYFNRSYMDINKNENFLSNVEKLIEKSTIRQGFEQCHSIPLAKSKRALKLERKELRKKSKGKKWFDIPATELTDEIKTDFELLKMRSVLERKPVYKKNNITKIPKYFQVGKVIESSADFYGGRIPKSLRKNTMVDELLEDANFKRYQKKKFKEIMDENRRKKRTKKYLKVKGMKEKNKH